MTPNHDVVQKLLGALKDSHQKHMDAIGIDLHDSSVGCKVCQLIAQTEAQLAGETATPADPKTRVVEILQTFIPVSNLQLTPNQARFLADRLDSAGLLASAPVVPSITELDELIMQSRKSAYTTAEAIRNHILTLGYKYNSSCEWKQDEDGNWFTACGDGFTFINSGPSENNMKFCSSCGRPLKEIGWREK